MGSGKKVTVGYRYSLGVHKVLCHGPVDKITRIDVDGKTAWTGTNSGGTTTINAPGLFGGESREGGVYGNVDVMMGGASQGRNAYLQSQLGADIPAFRGVVSAVLNRVYIGLNPYLKTWAFWASRIHVRQDGRAQWYDAKSQIGDDMNPAHIIREVLTDPDWGMGYPEAEIDDASFTAAADTLFAEGFGLSFLWDKSTQIDEFLGEVLKHIDGSLFVDRGTGKFTLRLARGGYDVGSLITLDEDSIQRVDDFKRGALAELSNSVTVVFWDATTGKDNAVTVQDISLIAAQGGTIGVTLRYPGITLGTLASRVASRDLRALSVPLASAAIYANRKASSLNVGDVFKLSWPRFGVSQTVMRVSNIELGSLASNTIKITCVEDVFSLGDAVYAAPPPTEWQNPNTVPLPCPQHSVIEAPYYEVVQRIGDSFAQALDPDAAFVVATGSRPAGSAINARLMSNPAGTYEDYGHADFCPTALLVADLDIGATTAALGSIRDQDQIAVGSYAILGGVEIVSVIGLVGTTLTIGRGCLDTVPVAHASGARIMFSDVFFETDGIEYATGETARVKLLPVTGIGELPLAAAPEQTVTMNRRQFRPYPPGRLRINGLKYPTIITEDTITVSWAHRDRLMQTGATIEDTEAGNIGPEAGTTYTVDVRRADNNALLGSQSGLSGTSAVFDSATFGTYLGGVRIIVKSVRDGVESWQSHSWTVGRTGYGMGYGMGYGYDYGGTA